MSESDRLSAGDRAPAFHLVDQHGDAHRLSEFKGNKVMVFFYPRPTPRGAPLRPVVCGTSPATSETPS
ncbi:MAG: redoxin family protein [Microthrixaceae bacterium]|nr:redoxin family protein [Microthrixaceae bacterium]